MISIDSKIELEKCKVVIVGNCGVGKTCIINNLINKKFDEDEKSTLSANFINLKLRIDELNKIIDFDIWDTAGQEQYRSLGNYFYRDSYVVILVYDISNKQSFENLKNLWFKDLKTFGERYTVLAIVGNKSDLFEEEEVPEDEARKFAEEQEAIFMLVSAKNGNNIENLFNDVLGLYLDPDFQIKVDEMSKMELLHSSIQSLGKERICSSLR